MQSSKNIYSCNSLETQLIKNKNFYDIRREDDYDFSNISNFLNQKKVQSALNLTSYKYWKSCDNTVFRAFRSYDWVTDYVPSI
jgi:hypothetical protein